ncbi:MAG: hypothetical protein ACFFCM_13565 [Promethearchaeota archaeon]
MTNVLIIISKEKFSRSKTQSAIEISKTIQKKGNSTTVYLVEDGVYLGWDVTIDELIKTGIIIKADEWDIKARGLKGKINEKIEIKTTDDLFDEITEKNDKVLWF